MNAPFWILVGVIVILLVGMMYNERVEKRFFAQQRKEIDDLRRMISLKNTEIKLLKNINVELEQQVEIQKEVVATQDALLDCQRRTVDQIRQLG